MSAPSSTQVHKAVLPPMARQKLTRSAPLPPRWTPLPLCLQREGLRGFYKGLVPNVLRVMPQSALTFLVYESVMRVLAAQQAQQQQQGRM